MKKPEQQQTEIAEDGREPYEPPRLEVEELFEVLALACGKVQPVNVNCQRLARQS